MSISAFDLFKIGIGPSSSHTVGPMKAARQFAQYLQQDSIMFELVARVKAELFGSLGLTGKGHGSPKAVLLGLEGETPEHVDVERIADRVRRIEEQASLSLMGVKSIGDMTECVRPQRVVAVEVAQNLALRCPQACVDSSSLAIVRLRCPRESVSVFLEDYHASVGRPAVLDSVFEMRVVHRACDP